MVRCSVIPSGRWLGLYMLFALALVAVATYSQAVIASAESGPCAQGRAIAEPELNLELVNDCNVLLGVRGTLAGDAELNWSADLSISQWDGVRVFQTPSRVVSLRLAERELSGFIPSGLGHLDALEVLDLSGNMLTGHIPLELGSLESLQYLYLDDNGLTGRVPADLGSLTKLRHLIVNDNGLTGYIPSKLAGLRQVEYLFLYGNDLSGCIPAALTDRADLTIRTDDLEPCSEDAPDPSESCENGTAVADPEDHQMLVQDCETLLTVRDILAGEASLNWSAGIPIMEWKGVTVDGDPLRVVGLSLVRSGLTGEIPAELGALASLRWLMLGSNRLTGKIPEALGRLSNPESTEGGRRVSVLKRQEGAPVNLG